MKYCAYCAHTLSEEVPDGDNRLRKVCHGCGVIHYQNPRIVAGTVPLWKDQVLLCRRAIEPRRGFWTLPAGFLELNETVAEGARRETWEEAAAQVEMLNLYSVINVPYIGQVHMFHLARLLDGTFGVGEESLEVRLFERDRIPWKELAFRSVSLTLKTFWSDYDQGFRIPTNHPRDLAELEDRQRLPCREFDLHPPKGWKPQKPAESPTP